MLWSSKSSGKKGQIIESLIGAGTSIEGNLIFKGGLRVDGAVRGSISSTSGDLLC